MKRIFTLMTLMMVLSSTSLFAQNVSRREAKKAMEASVLDESKIVNPTFGGGSIDDFALWVQAQVEYPRSFTRSNSLSRVVLVEFTVNAEGEVVDIHASFGSNPELNAAAVKAVAKSPKWEPGKYKGKNIGVRLTVPVVFENE